LPLFEDEIAFKAGIRLAAFERDIKVLRSSSNRCKYAMVVAW
jgi:hypothetical protein